MYSDDFRLQVALQELHLRGFSLATIPEESRLKVKGDVLIMRDDKVFAYAADVNEAVELVRDFIKAKNKLKGK